MDRTTQRVRIKLAGRIFVKIASRWHNGVDNRRTSDSNDSSAHVQVLHAQPKRLFLRSHDRHFKNNFIQQVEHPSESDASVGEMCAERRLYIAAGIPI